MEIKEGLVKLDKPTNEVNVYVKRDVGTLRAIIHKATQDKLGRVYLTVE